MADDGSKGEWSAEGVSVPPKPIAEGAGLRVRQLYFPLPTENGTWLDNRDWNGALLTLCSKNDDDLQAWGTAFLVAPGIAITAAHVVTDYEKKGRLDPGSLFLMGGRNGQLVIWNVIHAQIPELGDVAVLSIEPRFEHEWPLEIEFFRITAKSPTVGERVSTIGLKASKDSFDHEEPVVIHGIVSAGEVLDFYADRKDRAPHFGATLTTIGGMSGGPVFDKKGDVCGVVTSSVATSDSEYVTFATLLWGALHFQVDVPWPEGMYKEPVKLISHAIDAWRVVEDPLRGLGYNWSDEPS